MSLEEESFCTLAGRLSGVGYEDEMYQLDGADKRVRPRSEHDLGNLGTMGYKAGR